VKRYLRLVGTSGKPFFLKPHLTSPWGRRNRKTKNKKLVIYEHKRQHKEFKP
jgi:hypothetical protein